jgi:hypothetical protein
MNIQTKRAAGFGIAHFILLVACYLTSFTLAMERFDTHDGNTSTVEYVTVSLTEVLMSPGKYLWTSWASKNLHDAFEWVLLTANSALWGIALAYVFKKAERAT